MYSNLQLSNQDINTHTHKPKAPEILSWHAVCVRPRWEKIAASALQGKDYDSYVPLYRKKTRRSDRVKDSDVPLFPGYVFCRGVFAEKPLLVTTPGVLGILKFAGVPAIVSEREIEAIRDLTRSGAYLEPCPYLGQGQRVRVHSGPFEGTEGILLRTKHNCRVVLSVEALYRSVAIEVSRECVTPMSSASAA